MIVQLLPNITPDITDQIINHLDGLGYKSTRVTTQSGDYLVCIGKAPFDIRSVGQLLGIQDVHMVSDDYQLVSSKWKVNPTVISFGDDIHIGDGSLTLMTGPCSIESEQQINDSLDHITQLNIPFMRGGVYKPRSSPYSFRGLGQEGLKLWSDQARKKGVKIISEVMEVSQIEEMYDFVDIYQVGARNTQNFNLLDELGRIDKPIMLKRGISGTIEELLYSAEYIFSAGNEKILLCERGIRTYETASRNTFDINAIPILKAKSHLPVVADPSHGIGIRQHVPAIAMAAVMAGADAIIFESHSIPEKAWSDGQQTLDFRESEKLVAQLRAAHQLRKAFY
jgi:3-deoxy-7-phosphoheptulonate synthase